MLWARLKVGETLTLTATGPDAQRALEACREMHQVSPEERKAMYRQRYSGLRLAGAARRSCKVCEHPERATIDKTLAVGQSPRSIIRRYAGLSRKAVQRHCDECRAGSEARGGG